MHGFQKWQHHEPTLRDTARGVRYQNRVLAAVRGFFRFLRDDGAIAHDPAAVLEYAREPETLPKNILTPGEARRIIEAADPSTVLGYRDRVILETLYATGIRKTELLNLTLADVNLEEEILRINGGKGAKDRVVPLTRVAAAGLETYIKAVRPQLLGKKESGNQQQRRRHAKATKKFCHRSKLLVAAALVGLQLTIGNAATKAPAPASAVPRQPEFPARIQGSRGSLEPGQPRDSLWLCRSKGWR